MRVRRLAGLLAGPVFAAAPVHAEEVTAIRAGRLVDVDRGEVRRDQLIVVRGDRVESMAPGSARPPAGARLIDLSRYAVVPGLIDCHTHLIGEVGLSDVLLPLERSGAREALSGVRNARATLLAGFTTVRDVGTYRAFVDAALRDAIDDGTVPGNDETTDAQRAGFRRAVAAGVKIAYGTDSGVYPHGLNARQLSYMVRYGMTPMQALQSATIGAAEMMGWQDRVGSIATGKYADIVAVEGDPMGDLKRFEQIGFVMKGGVVHKAP